MSYPGGKAAMGAAQQIISQMPPHEYYVELFLGAGAVMLKKRPALFNFGVDIDQAVIDQFPKDQKFHLNTECANAFDVLVDLCEGRILAGMQLLIYADPPYLQEVLKSRQRYRYKFSREDHIRLIRKLREVPGYVILSGYDSELYQEQLHDWRTHSFSVAGRDGKSHIETLWMNFEEPTRLHDYRFIGENYRAREIIRKRLKRTAAKIHNWPLQEQAAIIKTLFEQFKEAEKRSLGEKEIINS